MNITLFKNMSDNKVVSKNLQGARVISGVLKEGCSLVHPHFIVDKIADYYFKGYNYLLYGETGRYYYINDIEFLTGHRADISCTEDVLMTYSDAIRSLVTVVERQESIYNPYLEDSGICITQGSVIKAIDVGVVGDESYTCYMTAIGAVGEEE